MSDSRADADHEASGVDATNELRTIAFRMREIQRLLAARVEQENRRLEADGIDPVPQDRFVDAPADE